MTDADLGIAELVRRARAVRGHTQGDMAEELGLSRRTVVRIEHGEQRSLGSGNLALIREYLEIAGIDDLASVRGDLHEYD